MFVPKTAYDGTERVYSKCAFFGHDMGTDDRKRAVQGHTTH